jgi:hypothetical protein
MRLMRHPNGTVLDIPWESSPKVFLLSLMSVLHKSDLQCTGRSDACGECEHRLDDRTRFMFWNTECTPHCVVVSYVRKSCIRLRTVHWEVRIQSVAQ